ncbi:hypothetical protein D9757_005407 [Collybiopsis confluens]|uniref:Uncharacterized protein n=1 Tax=Collybiopsis confluens TaxID=2823264 RepID=A0A8H5HLF6_9AGAR|nr:hypothetical protein D9757_005407 [Collybiopsis confluens]
MILWRNWFAVLSRLGGDPTSHKIVTTFRVEEFVSDEMVHRISSLEVYRMLRTAFTRVQLGERHKLYQMLHSSKGLGVPLGWLFESMTGDEFIKGGRFVACDVYSGEQTFLDIGTLDLTVFSNRSVPRATVARSRCYVPMEGNNPTFDTFCITSDNVGIGFQMTGVNLKGLTALKKRFDAAQVARCYFVIFNKYLQLGLILTNDLSTRGLINEFAEYDAVDKDEREPLADYLMEIDESME